MFPFAKIGEIILFTIQESKSSSKMMACWNPAGHVYARPKLKVNKKGRNSAAKAVWLGHAGLKISDNDRQSTNNPYKSHHHPYQLIMFPKACASNKMPLELAVGRIFPKPWDQRRPAACPDTSKICASAQA